MKDLKLETLVDLFMTALEDGLYNITLENHEVIPIRVYNHDNVVYEESPSILVNATNSPLIVLKYKNLEIKNNVTLTTSEPCRGLCIYAEKIINNGLISMTARGAASIPGQNILLSRNENDGYEMIADYGGEGGVGKFDAGPIYKGTTYAYPGAAGVNRSSGGGGAGAGRGAKGGNGSKGTSFSGGSGGGGGNNYNGGDAKINGGAGGIGNSSAAGGQSYGGSGGGSGNPGGSIYNTDDYYNVSVKGLNGTGGLIIIYATSIENNGSILSNGVQGAGGYRTGGGGTGGGSINIFGKIEKSGVINVDGGLSGMATRGEESSHGGGGGMGSITTTTYFNKLEQAHFIQIDKKLKYYHNDTLYELNKDENNITIDDFRMHGMSKFEYGNKVINRTTNNNIISLLVASNSNLLKASKICLNQQIKNKEWILLSDGKIKKVTIAASLYSNVIKCIFGLKSNEWYWFNKDTWEKINIENFSDTFGGNTTKEINNLTDSDWTKFQNLQKEIRSIKICLLAIDNSFDTSPIVRKIEVKIGNDSLIEIPFSYLYRNYTVKNSFDKIEIKWTGAAKQQIKIYYN